MSFDFPHVRDSGRNVMLSHDFFVTECDWSTRGTFPGRTRVDQRASQPKGTSVRRITLSDQRFSSSPNVTGDKRTRANGPLVPTINDLHLYRTERAT